MGVAGGRLPVQAGSLLPAGPNSVGARTPGDFGQRHTDPKRPVMLRGRGKFPRPSGRRAPSAVPIPVAGGRAHILKDVGSSAASISWRDPKSPACGIRVRGSRILPGVLPGGIRGRRGGRRVPLQGVEGGQGFPSPPPLIQEIPDMRDTHVSPPCGDEESAPLQAPVSRAGPYRTERCRGTAQVTNDVRSRGPIRGRWSPIVTADLGGRSST